MATKLELHDLPGEKRAGEIVRLVERLYGEGRRLVIWVADEGLRTVLDDYLWTFRKLSFVPHVPWDETLGEVKDPVVLLGATANPNDATVLVVGDEPPPGEWAASFDEVHDFIPPGDVGEERRSFWAEWRRAAGE